MFSVESRVFICSKVKTSVQFHAEQAHRGGKGIAPLVLDPSARRGWVVSATRSQLYPRKGDPVPSVKEAV